MSTMAELLKKERETIFSLEVKTLLGYTFEIFDIQEFKKYYDDNDLRFNSFSKNAFLKAVSIPPSYFLEQPIETQTELLENKVNLSNTSPKYDGVSVIVVSKDNVIVNAFKMKSDEVEVSFERISSIEECTDIVWDRTFHKDGYICGYLVCGTVSKEGFTRVLFVDLPLIFSKPTTLHEGFLKLANSNMAVEKDMVYYTNTEEVNYDEYQHIALALEDKLPNVPAVKSVDEEEDTDFDRSSTDIVCELVDNNAIPKSLLTPLCKYIDKTYYEENLAFTKHRLLESIIIFDLTVKSLKHVNMLRSAKAVIDEMKIYPEITETELE